MKKKLRRLCALTLERIAYFSGLNVLFYGLNRNAKRIITFHHIFPDELVEKVRPDCLAHSLSDFEKIITLLGKRYPFSLDMGDPRSVTLTFDDGYQSQYDCAAQSLISMEGVNAYLFVSGAVINAPSALTVDLLTAWVAYAPTGEYRFTFKDEPITFQLTEDNRAFVWQTIIRKKYLEDSDAYGENILTALDHCYPIKKIIESLPADYQRLRFKGVTREMLEDLKSKGWGIGGHGYAHYPFGYLSKPQCEKDILDGVEALAPYKTTDVYSYPFGGRDTIGEIAPEIMKTIGATCAVANEVQPLWTTTKWYLPRMALSANKYTFHFELSGCKYFFRHRKLLPKVTL